MSTSVRAVLNRIHTGHWPTGEEFVHQLIHNMASSGAFQVLMMVGENATQSVQTSDPIVDEQRNRKNKSTT